MNAAELMTEIIQAGGEIWAEGDRLKFRDTPARLVPELRLHKTEVLAELQKCEHVNVVNMDSGLYPPDANSPQPGDEVHTDGYAIEERLAIQSEDDLPPDRGFDDVPGFEGMPDLTPAQHGAILHRIMYPAQESPTTAKSTTDATITPTMQHSADMAPQSAPATVSCGQCVRFQPGTTKMGIGSCLAAVTGQPPAGNRGDYRAAFPMAPRRCTEFLGSQS